jgi:hypothetical protein
LEVMSRRRSIGHQPEVATSTSTRVSALLEC